MPEDNEIDEFHKNREKIMLDEAGEYGNGSEASEEEDDEVLGVDEGLDEDEGLEEEEEEEGEEEEGWGRKSDYYGGDEVDDTEASKAMTEEAIRQQKKNLQELGMEDYIDDDMMEEWDQKAEEFDAETQKTQMVINDGATDLDKLDTKEKMEMLTESFPEFVPLLNEWNELKPVLSLLGGSGDLLAVKREALTAYLGAIACYFSIFTEQVKSGEAFGSMKEHPVMETILTTRQVWKNVDEVVRDSSDDEFMDARDEDEDEEIDQREIDEEMDIEGEEMEGDDIEDDMEEGSEEDSEEDSEESEESSIDITSKRNIRKAKTTKGDHLEADTPDDVDDEDKQRRKKSLRFYTSKIDQAQVKNAEKLNGDEDLPYKERLFERKQRLLEEARKRGAGETKQALGDDLDGGEMNSEDEQMAREINGNSDDDEYYQTMKASKQSKKDSRTKAHKEATRLAREGKLAEGQEVVGTDGKRALNYQIMKNKGLTAKKNKDIRNARVKKRKKYEQAKKKVKSVRAVYEGEKKYEGEKSGIKKGLSRSVKLV